MKIRTNNITISIIQIKSQVNSTLQRLKWYAGFLFIAPTEVELPWLGDSDT